MGPAIRAITIPIIAKNKAFFPASTLLGIPAEVRKKNPAIIIIIVANPPIRLATTVVIDFKSSGKLLADMGFVKDTDPAAKIKLAEQIIPAIIKKNTTFLFILNSLYQKNRIQAVDNFNL